MKTVGVVIENVLMNWIESFHRVYYKTFIFNEEQIFIDKDINTLTEEIKEKEKKYLNLPVNTYDLLNHYWFDELEWEVENIPENQKDRIFDNIIKTTGEKIKLTAQENLEMFIKLNAFQIYGEASSYYRQNNLFNELQKIGEETKTYKTVVLTKLSGASLNSLFFFLAKENIRPRYFAKVDSDEEKWNFCDILIDAIPDVITNIPENKKLIKINREFNVYYNHDISFNSLEEVIKSEILKS